MKTNKELAVELAASYIEAVYSHENVKLPDAQALKTLLRAFYDAVKEIPND